MLDKVNETFKDIYDAIDVMETTINEQRTEIKRLRDMEQMDQLLIKELLGKSEQLLKERDDASVDQRLIDELWQRRTDASETNARMRQLLKDTEQLLKERDEARREVCDNGERNIRQAYAEAIQRGWDCYKETP